MSHWAELDENNIVLRVIVASNDEEDEGYSQIIETLGGRWIQTSYNARIRKNYAGIGYYYDEIKDAFIPPEPILEGEQFVLNEETCRWEIIE